MEIFPAAPAHRRHLASEYSHLMPGLSKPTTQVRVPEKCLDTYPSPSSPTLSKSPSAIHFNHNSPAWLPSFNRILELYSQLEVLDHQFQSSISRAPSPSSPPASAFEDSIITDSDSDSIFSTTQSHHSESFRNTMSSSPASGRFHLRSRRRQTDLPTPPLSNPTSSSPPQTESSWPTTPDQSSKSDPADSSSLSSVPSSLGTTPECLSETKPRGRKRLIRYESPLPKVPGKKRAKTDASSKVDSQSPDPKSATRTSRRQKSDSDRNSVIPTPPAKKTRGRPRKQSNDDERIVTSKSNAKAPEKSAAKSDELRKASKKRKLEQDDTGAAGFALPDNGSPSSQTSSGRHIKPKVHFEEAILLATNMTARMMRTSGTKKPSTKPNSRRAGDDNFDFHDYKDKTIWPEYKPKRPIYYGADAKTRYKASIYRKASSHRTKSGTGSPKRNGRGGGSGRGGRGGGFTNGSSVTNGTGSGTGSGRGKGRPRGGGRPRGNGSAGQGGAGRGNSSSPERKRNLSPGAEESLVILKKRQQELKAFFKAVGTQQYEILDQLAARDLQKLVRKPKAHQQVPEHNEVFTELISGMKDAILLAQTRNAIQQKHDREMFEREKEVIEARYRTRVENARQEHIRGSQGDMLLFVQAHEASKDDTRTEPDLDIPYFPQYHPNPDPEVLRGYNSTHITDEKAFKFSLDASAYEDLVRRDVLDADVLAPIVREINIAHEARAADEARRKTQTMAALSEEAAKQLSEIKGYLIPRPIKPSEQSAFALSALADMSEWRSHQAYIYMPLAPGEPFPRNALNYDPLPGTSASAQQRGSPAAGRATASPYQHQRQPQQQQLQQQKFAPPPPPYPTSNLRGSRDERRSSGSRLPPPPPLPPSMQGQPQQYVFQQQNLYPHPQPLPPPPQHGHPGHQHPQLSPMGMGMGMGITMTQHQQHQQQQAANAGRPPVTFVNQTVQSRKQSAVGGGGVGIALAGSPGQMVSPGAGVGTGLGAGLGAAGGKGQPRMLLPKML